MSAGATAVRTRVVTRRPLAARPGLLRGVVGFLTVAGVWQLVVLSGRWPETLLPAPLAVFREAWRIATDPELVLQVLDTVRRVTVAGAIGLVLGVLAGALVSVRDGIAQTVEDFALFMQSIGEVGWLPLLILWLGFGDLTVIVAISYTVFFPVYFNTVRGFRSIPRNLRQGLQTLGANDWQVIRHVVVPGALPSIIAGFRTGFGFGWRTVILAEMLVATTGIGAILFRAREFFLVERIMAGMLFIGILWIIVDSALLQPLEKRTVRKWQVVA